ncbi:YfhO family protein [Alkalicoccobacillus murimartini]|uniref:Membrane protein YfhO n=1 Tax=Alkalicoccobacillus murimartini TaxID=171685 RepID=A0ABT9YKU0_9BACI|nr:YfhO family protein [Alkalicoccobacillus murimartini]MDQ0208491.1 putative membrane protein YfhO [Alkalicoccobacillus murimartini]
MKRKSKFWLLLSISLAFAFLAHFFFLKELSNGRYMVGPNDGLAQMLPFKHFLYQQYTSGEWFYSHEFGLGSGTFAQLAYYFSTNMVFLVTVFFVWLMELLSIIGSPDILFWAQAGVFVSVFRMTLILMITTAVFRYFKLGFLPSLAGAMIYASSVMYYRHASFWEFFADAYLWIPLLVLGIEKIIREKQPMWFILALSLTLLTNFYFGYMSCLFVAIYVLLRWIIRFNEDKASIFEQVKLYIPAVVLSFAIGAISFIPAVYGFLNNYRPPFEDPIELLDIGDNILFTSRTFIIPALFISFLFIPTLFRHKTFRYFAVLSLLFVVMHYIPLAASVFNGFSAPQNRFEYMGSFAIGGAIAVALSKLAELPRKQMMLSALLTAILFSIVYGYDRWQDLSPLDYRDALVVLPIMLFAFIWVSWKRPIYGIGLLTISVAATQLLVSYHYQDKHLSQAGNLTNSNKEYIEEIYQPPEQTELIHSVLDQDEDPLARLEWVVGGRSGSNNTGMVQDFPSISSYSSVLNQHLLFFYYEDLEIDMKRESVSRYSGFGDRANLYSLLGGKYILFPKDEEIHAPYGFEPFEENEHYVVYRNENMLPFARTTSTVYSEEQLNDLPAITREHAMLDGVVLENPQSTTEISGSAENLIRDVDIEAVGGTYEDGVLTITDDRGGLDLHVPSAEAEGNGDFYLSFHLLNQSESARLFRLDVNDFTTDRKSRESIYRTGINDLTIRVPKEETLSIRMREGSYEIDEFSLYSENFTTLNQAVESANDHNIEVNINGSKMDFSVENATDTEYLTIPVPYEKGWTVKVNGETRSIEKANYSFMAVSLDNGENQIKFSYLPPFFRESAIATIAGLLLTSGWYFWRRKRTR